MRPDDKAEIARRFKTLRRRSYLTQSDLSEFIRVSRQAVSDIERRRVLPHRSTWNRFAALEAKHESDARAISSSLGSPFCD